MWILLKEKDLHFILNGEVLERRIGRKRLPQSSVPSPLLYNLVGSDIDQIMPQNISNLQYADDIVIYVPDHTLQKMQKRIQTSLSASTEFLSNLGLTQSFSKSEAVLFTRKLSLIAPALYINKNLITTSKQFKYLGVFLIED
jgi:Reverse transcriptase (RNA-dependent DNA polymerase)